MAPVPAHIVGRHKLYKAGTERLAQYLARTANAFCDVQSLTGGGTEVTSNHQRTVKISTRDFLALARTIAGAAPAVVVPAYILRLTENVIAGRRYCAEWYSSQPSSKEMDEQNNRHAHFIEILQEVFGLLSSCIVQSRSRKPQNLTASTEPSESQTLSNLFALLDVEDAPEDIFGTAAASSPSAPRLRGNNGASVTRCEFVEESHGGVAFEIWCLLKDLQDLRVSARDDWVEYGQGDVSAFVAGVVSNTAFGLMRRHAADFHATNPDLDEYWGLLTALNVRVMALGKLFLIMPGEAGKSPQQLSSDINPAALLCPAAALLLQQFLEVTTKKLAEDACQTPEGRELHAELKANGYDPLAWDTLDHCRGHRFGETLLHHSRRIVTHARDMKLRRIAGATCDTLADEFLEGLFGMCGDVCKGIPIWMVVACQTYMDIYDILGNCVDAGATALIRCHIETAVAVKQFNAVREQNTFSYLEPSWQEHFVDMAGESFQFAKSMEVLRKLNTADRGVPDVTVGLASLPIETILDLPVMPCEMLRTLELANLVYGTTVCNDGYVVLGLAHYYTTLRKYGKIEAWEDMDTVIAQNKNLVMKTAANADPYAMARHYRLALGVDASKLSRNCSSDHLPGYSQIRKKAKVVEITATAVNTVAKCNARSSRRSSDEIFELLLSEVARLPAANATAANAKGTVSGNSITPTQFLKKLKEHLVADEVQLNFDYMSFSRTCVEVMAGMTAIGHPVLPGKSGRQLTHFYELVDVLLREAADAVTKRRPLGTTVFSQSVSILEEMIAKGGGRLTQAALERSSGHIPQQLRPTLPCLKDYKSAARASLKSKGFKFDGPRENAAIYPPSHATAELQEDVELVRRRLCAWKATGCEGPQSLKALHKDIAGEVGRAIGMHRWFTAVSLIELQMGEGKLCA
ncbi:hypothetical protein LTR27_011088 [Elasticomyces elasticus]|nr:hypothetical protein LTR27_011088 [Elasticomyces elasticus]